MSLPKHINLAACVSDPHGRVNHIFHAATDEVFHVTPELFAAVRKIGQKAGKKKAHEPQDAPETGLTLAEAVPAEQSEEAEAEAPHEQQPQASASRVEDTLTDTVPGPDRGELLAMAESLELTVPEGISDADLLALVETAVQVETAVAE